MTKPRKKREYQKQAKPPALPMIRRPADMTNELLADIMVLARELRDEQERELEEHGARKHRFMPDGQRDKTKQTRHAKAIINGVRVRVAPEHGTQRQRHQGQALGEHGGGDCESEDAGKRAQAVA